MSIESAGAERATVPRVPGKPFVKGDPRIKPGPGRPARPTQQQIDKAREVLAKAEPLAAQLSVHLEPVRELLEKTEQAYARMSPAEMARAATRPALARALAIVADDAADPALALRAAELLLRLGWGNAPVRSEVQVESPAQRLDVEALRAIALRVAAQSATDAPLLERAA